MRHTAGREGQADLGIKLENVTVNMLGRAQKVMIDNESVGSHRSVSAVRGAAARRAKPRFEGERGRGPAAAGWRGARRE